MQPLGYQQTRSLTVLNSVMDTDSFSSAKMKPVDPSRVLYPSTGDARDHTIRRGDVIVCKKRAAHWGLEQLPKTRACLNGLAIEEADDDDPEPQDLVEAFWKEYTFIGVSRKDISVKLSGVAGAPQIATEPVAVANGIFTITNTGRERIEAGDAIEVYLLDRRSRPRAQYEGKRARLNDDRVVLGTRTYDITCRDPIRFFDSSPALFGALLHFVQTLARKLAPEMVPNDEVLRIAFEESKTFRDSICRLINKLHKSTRDAWRTSVGVAQSSNAEGLRVEIMAHPAARVKLDIDESYGKSSVVTKSAFSATTVKQVADSVRKTLNKTNHNVFMDSVNVGKLVDELFNEMNYAPYVNASRKDKAVTQMMFVNYFQRSIVNASTPFPEDFGKSELDKTEFTQAYVHLQGVYDAKFENLSDDEFKKKFIAWKYAKLYRAFVGLKDPGVRYKIDGLFQL